MTPLLEDVAAQEQLRIITVTVMDIALILSHPVQHSNTELTLPYFSQKELANYIMVFKKKSYTNFQVNIHICIFRHTMIPPFPYLFPVVRWASGPCQSL